MQIRLKDTNIYANHQNKYDHCIINTLDLMVPAGCQSHAPPLVEFFMNAFLIKSN